MKTTLNTITGYVALLTAFTMHGAEAISHDGKTILSTSVRDGMAVYSLSHDGKVMLHESPLGLMTNVGDFTNGIISVSEVPVHERNTACDKSKEQYEKFTYVCRRQDYAAKTRSCRVCQ